MVQAGDTMVLCTATVGIARRGLPSPHRRHRGADVRRGQDPRLVLPSRGQIQREGDPHRPHDRPSDSPALPQGLALRDAAGRDPYVGRPDPPLRHPRDERRLRCAGDLARPLRRPRRRGADRQARRRFHRQPLRGGPRRARSRPGRRRNRRGDPDGRGRCQRRHRAGDPRRARHRPRRDQEARRRDGGAAAEGRQGEDRGRGPDDRRGPDRRYPLLPRRGAGRRDRHGGQARALRGDRQGQGRGGRRARARVR